MRKRYGLRTVDIPRHVRGAEDSSWWTPRWAISGVICYVSKQGTEAHLFGIDKRYRFPRVQGGSLRFFCSLDVNKRATFVLNGFKEVVWFEVNRTEECGHGGA